MATTSGSIARPDSICRWVFQRSQFGTFPEYHTSADNLDFIRPQYLAQSFRWIIQAFEILENDRTFINLCPKGEPQLGKRGLYSGYGSGEDALRRNMAVLWVLNLSDGTTHCSISPSGPIFPLT